MRWAETRLANQYTINILCVNVRFIQVFQSVFQKIQYLRGRLIYNTPCPNKSFSGPVLVFRFEDGEGKFRWTSLVAVIGALSCEEEYSLGLSVSRRNDCGVDMSRGADNGPGVCLAVDGDVSDFSDGSPCGLSCCGPDTGANLEDRNGSLHAKSVASDDGADAEVVRTRAEPVSSNSAECPVPRLAIPAWSMPWFS